MGIKRRAFLIGGVAIVGGGLFAVKWSEGAAARDAATRVTKPGEASLGTWLKIGEDDTVTLYSPHIDFGQGSHTALAQMLADELDADWAKLRVEQAPAEPAFANTPLAMGFVLGDTQIPSIFRGLATAGFSMIARNMPVQITGGSSAVRITGQYGMRVVGAAARTALIETAAKRLNVPAAELTTANSRVLHAASGKSLRYGELAAEAATHTLSLQPVLKPRKDYKFIGKPVHRLDIPAKVDGSAVYGIDFSLPEMRIATIMAAPIRGGKLVSVDPAPALAVAGVEKVIKLDDAVAVVATGYWAALKGLRALAPKFSDGGHGALSSDTIFAAQHTLRAAGKPDNEAGEGDVAKGFADAKGKTLEADFRVPFLHQAMMEPFALSAHLKDGKLDVWGGMQDPISTKLHAAKAADLSPSKVTFHPMIMGGGFGRRFPDYCEIIAQVTKIAMQVPHPVKLIWSREEEVRQGAYRPQSSAHLKAALGADGKIAAWQTDYVQKADAESETVFPYTIAATARRHYDYISNQGDAYWRSVNSTQHGFYNESFIDELAHAAGADPLAFRLAHLKPGSRHARALETVARNAGWGSKPEQGRGRGIALVESFGTIVAQVVEASIDASGRPRAHKVWAAVDCGTTVNPLNGAAQIEGGIIMGLSAAIGEAITLRGGAVEQSNFGDYPILGLAEAPEISITFIESDAPLGGLGEPGLPPVAPALANALFAISGKRYRQLPLASHAGV